MNGVFFAAPFRLQLFKNGLGGNTFGNLTKRSSGMKLASASAVR